MIYNNCTFTKANITFVLGKYEVKCAKFASVVSLISDKCKEQQSINFCRLLGNEFNLSPKQLEATLLITFCQLQNWIQIDDMFVNKVMFLNLMYQYI